MEFAYTERGHDARCHSFDRAIFSSVGTDRICSVQRLLQPTGASTPALSRQGTRAPGSPCASHEPCAHGYARLRCPRCGPTLPASAAGPSSELSHSRLFQCSTGSAVSGCSRTPATASSTADGRHHLQFRCDLYSTSPARCLSNRNQPLSVCLGAPSHLAVPLSCLFEHSSAAIPVGFDSQVLAVSESFGGKGPL
jgi:hypothetical protein